MDTVLATPDPVETPIPAAPESEPANEAPEPAESIADHAAQFGKKAEDDEAPPKGPANTGQFANRDPDKRRHANSQRATPEDVAEINRLTRELRETEQRLGDKDPDATSSPRIRTLKRQLAALKALEAPAATPAPPTPTPRQESKVAAEPSQARAAAPESRSKPTEDEIGTKYQTYAEFVEDLADWKVEQREIAQATSRQQQEATERERALITSYQQRTAEFSKTKPDFATVTAPILERHLPGVLLAALVTDDKGPENVYYLAQHPDILDELILLTDGKPVTDASVAVVQRRVRQHAQAATTGSATVPKPTFNPPRPPNPVRTGPTKTADEPPGDGASIADHARFYDPNKRR